MDTVIVYMAITAPFCLASSVKRFCLESVYASVHQIHELAYTIIDDSTKFVYINCLALVYASVHLMLVHKDREP